MFCHPPPFPLSLVTINRINIYKNCIVQLFSGVIACSSASYACLGITSCLLWGCTLLFKRGWYLRTLLRTLKAVIENTNQLLENLSRLPRKNLGSFMRFSTVLVFSLSNACSFYKKAFFVHSTEMFLTFPRFQYLDCLKTFLAQVFEFQCFAHRHG